MTSSPDSGRGATNLSYSVSSVSTRTQRAATTLSMPLHLKFKEKSVSNLGPPIQHQDSMVPIRSVVVVAFLVLLILVTVIGGYLFLWVETDAPKTVPVSFSTCFATAKKMTNATHEEIISNIEKCVLRSTSIGSPGEAFMYSWGLISTVGYGDRYPHTAWGQVLTLFYAWLFIPLFMAFKIEMGEIIALSLLYIGRAIFKVFQKVYKAIRNRSVSADEPGDALLSFLLSLVFAFVICITATVFMLIDDIDWWSAFYSSWTTVMLVGLGDYVPGTQWIIFVVLLPLFLFGDVLCSYLFYYMHGLMRIQIHRFADWATTKKAKIHPSVFDTPPSPEPVVTVNASRRRSSMFPVLTTTSMPFSRTLSNVIEAREHDVPMGSLSIRRKPQ